MCHNKETSLVIFIFSLSVIIELIVRGVESQDSRYIFASLYLFSLSLMQLVEFFIHKYDNSQILYWMVLVAIVLQFITSEIYLYMNKLVPVYVCFLDIIFHLFILIVVIIIGKNITILDNNSMKDCGEWFIVRMTGCKLRWSVLEDMVGKAPILTGIAMLIFVVYITMSTYHLFHEGVFSAYIIILILTMGISFIFNKNPTFKTSGSSSAWCFFVIILSIVVIIFDRSCSGDRGVIKPQNFSLKGKESETKKESETYVHNSLIL